MLTWAQPKLELLKNPPLPMVPSYCRKGNQRAIEQSTCTSAIDIRDREASPPPPSSILSDCTSNTHMTNDQSSDAPLDWVTSGTNVSTGIWMCCWSLQYNSITLSLLQVTQTPLVLVAWGIHGHALYQMCHHTLFPMQTCHLALEPPLI